MNWIFFLLSRCMCMVAVWPRKAIKIGLCGLHNMNSPQKGMWIKKIVASNPARSILRSTILGYLLALCLTTGLRFCQAFLIWLSIHYTYKCIQFNKRYERDTWSNVMWTKRFTNISHTRKIQNAKYTECNAFYVFLSKFRNGDAFEHIQQQQQQQQEYFAMQKIQIILAHRWPSELEPSVIIYCHRTI